MLICEKGFSCCNYATSTSKEDVDEDGRDCQHLLEVNVVNHGRWNLIEEPTPFKAYRCSECGVKYFHADVMKFCPNCGVRMDKKLNKEDDDGNPSKDADPRD